jgi:CubicO group peptidase (beta-lactamase class C family)
MASSVEDLAHFVSLQFRYDQPASGPVLRGSTIKEMHRVQWLEEDWINGWGLGFSVRRIGSKVFVGHSGGAPGHSTMVHLCPADKFGLIVLTNVVAGDPMIYVQQAADILMPVILRALAKPDKTPDFDPAWRKYLGRYENRWGEAVVGVQNNRLVVQSITYPTLPAGVLIPEGEHTFRMEKGGNDGELVVFEVDSAGKVIRMTEAGEYLLRVE